MIEYALTMPTLSPILVEGLMSWDPKRVDGFHVQQYVGLCESVVPKNASMGQSSCFGADENYPSHLGVRGNNLTAAPQSLFQLGG